MPRRTSTELMALLAVVALLALFVASKVGPVIAGLFSKLPTVLP